MMEGKSRLSPRAIKAYQKILRELPRGYVARKVIAGKKRLYLQWRDGKVKSKYLRADEVDLKETAVEILRTEDDHVELACVSTRKHTAERDEGQLRHLADPEKLAWCERNYGPILSRTVLYRGEPFEHPSGVFYRNVGEYLKGLM